jgi:hypothetical protein
MPYQLPCARAAAAMAVYRPRRHLGLDSSKVKGTRTESLGCQAHDEGQAHEGPEETQSQEAKEGKQRKCEATATF